VKGPLHRRTLPAPSTPGSLSDRARAAYLGMALGDALGATVEFLTPREIAHQYGQHDQITGGGWLHLKPGAVTDDTTMALALGNALLDKGLDADAIAQAFDGWLRAKPVDCGNTVRRGIIHWRRTSETEVPLSEHDAGNGACMRVLPIALYLHGAEREALDAACRLQSHITHHNPLSDAGTLCVVECITAALDGADLDTLRDGPIARLVAEHPLFAYDNKRQENPSGYIVDTLRAVFQALTAQGDFRAVLVDVVNRGGDADTTGAIAGMIAGALYGFDELPQVWLARLDPRARELCEAQAEALIATAEVALA